MYGNMVKNKTDETTDRLQKNESKDLNESTELKQQRNLQGGVCVCFDVQPRHGVLKIFTNI